jgi:hypothetical protein
MVARRRRRRWALSRFRTPEVKQLRANGTQKSLLHSAHARRLSPVRRRVCSRPLACETARRSNTNFKTTFSDIPRDAHQRSTLQIERAQRRRALRELSGIGRCLGIRAYSVFLGLINHVLRATDLAALSSDKGAFFVRRLMVGRAYAYFIIQSMS